MKHIAYFPNSHNITVRDYHDAKNLGATDSNYIDEFKSGDLTSNAAGLGGDSARDFPQARYQNQSMDNEWQNPLYSSREPIGTNSRQFEVGGQKISPLRTHRAKDKGTDSANDRRTST